MGDLLTAEGLSLSFDGHQVLNGLALQVGEGQHTLVYGPSGSGKSSLLHLLGGLMAPDDGDISFRGQRLSSLGDLADYRRSNVGFVFQEFHLLENLTARQNLDMVSTNAGEDASDVVGLLSELGLADRADVPVKVLSRGERQRVSLARAFANDPTVVLADEPTASLDPSMRDQTMELLFSLCDRHQATAVVVSHDEALRQHARMVQRLNLEQGSLQEG